MNVLIVTGSMGAGKTTVVNEASDILTSEDVAHAAIDLDALGAWHVPSGVAVNLVLKNLAAVCDNYAAVGITRLLIAGAIEGSAELEGIRRAIPDATVMVVRLAASLDTMCQRVRERETGMRRATYVARVEVLDQILNGASLETLVVVNEGRSITEVAREVLTRARWLPS